MIDNNNYFYPQEAITAQPEGPDCKKEQEQDMATIAAAFAVFIAQQVALRIVDHLEQPAIQHLFKVREVE